MIIIIFSNRSIHCRSKINWYQTSKYLPLRTFCYEDKASMTLIIHKISFLIYSIYSSKILLFLWSLFINKQIYLRLSGSGRPLHAPTSPTSSPPYKCHAHESATRGSHQRGEAQDFLFVLFGYFYFAMLVYILKSCLFNILSKLWTNIISC